MKTRPNHRMYIEILRRMSPEERLSKAFELTDFTRELFRAGLRQRHPDLSEAELNDMFRRHMLTFTASR